MRNFIRFIIRYHMFFLFLLFETLCFYLIINYNHHHNQTFVNSSNRIVTSVMAISGNFSDYFSLKKANEELSRENTYLRTLLPDNILLHDQSHETIDELSDSIKFIYRPAKVVNNSINKRHNYITINKGKNHGIRPEMGIISARGIVGIVRHVSGNYSTVISVLNTQFRISAKLRDTNYFGSLTWDGDSWMYVNLTEIPAHAPLTIGEAVVTSGYSSIFPEEILIGTIEEFSLNQGEGFFNIKVKLSVDFKNLHYVEIIEATSGEEQIQLEKMTTND